jgi:hypothetical protein
MLFIYLDGIKQKWDFKYNKHKMKRENWLRDNIRSLIALMWTACGISIFIIILFKDIKADDKITFMIINSMVGIMSFILGYYFGASKSAVESKEKKIDPEQINQVDIKIN